MEPKTFTFLLVDEFTQMAFSCAVDALRIANLISGKEIYRWSFVSANGDTAKSSCGAMTLVHYGLDEIPKSDYLIVVSGTNVKEHATPDILAALRNERVKGTRIGALCSGAYVLAKAGFLDGLSAAIHWDFHDSFAEDFPQVTLVPNVFVADEPHFTSSGGAAAADLMLHLIESHHGRDLGINVADQMVYSTVRSSSAQQRVSIQARHGMRDPRLIKAIQMMERRIESPLPLQTFAENVGLSTRQLERLFRKHMDTSPKKYFMKRRLERAQHLLLQTEASVTEIAIACGFESSGHFSRVYRSNYGVTPFSQRTKLS